MCFISFSTKSIFIPINNCSSDLMSSHNTFRTLTTRISFLLRPFRTAFIPPWSVQLYFFPTRARNCCRVSLSLGSPEDQISQKYLYNSWQRKAARSNSVSDVCVHQKPMMHAHDISKVNFASPFLLAMLQNNWFILLAVHHRVMMHLRSWRALKKLELLPSCSLEQLVGFDCVLQRSQEYHSSVMPAKKTHESVVK